MLCAQFYGLSKFMMLFIKNLVVALNLKGDYEIHYVFCTILWFGTFQMVRSRAYIFDDAFNLKSHCNIFEVDYETVLCAQFHGLKIVHMVVVSHAYYSI